jgi:hypothetical protein
MVNSNNSNNSRCFENGHEVKSLTNSTPVDWPLGPGPTVQQNAMADNRFQSHSCRPLIGPIRLERKPPVIHIDSTNSLKMPHTS